MFSLDKSWWTEIGNKIISLVRTDSDGGMLQNPSGVTEHQYSTKMANKGRGKFRNTTNGQEYVKRKFINKGRVSSNVDMHYSGDLIDSLKVTEATKTGVMVKFTDPDAWAKIKYNIRSYNNPWNRLIDTLNPKNRDIITGMFNKELEAKIGKFNTSKITIKISGKI